jgi:hypothetical protein
MPRSAAVSLIVVLLAVAAFWFQRAADGVPRSAPAAPTSADLSEDRSADGDARERVADPAVPPPRRSIWADESTLERSAPGAIPPLPVQEPASDGFQLGFDPIDAASTMPVHVTVFTPEGPPLAAAKVQWVWAPESAELAFSAAVVAFENRMWRNHAAVPYAAAEGVTDAEGRVTLSVPRHLDGAVWLRVGHLDQVGYQQRLFGARFEGEQLRVVLQTGATLRGLVDGGLPSAEDFGPRTKVEGISVVAFRVDGDQTVFAKRAALELDGAAPRSWSISGLAPGVYEVKVMAWVSNPSSSQWKGLHTVPRRVLLDRGSASDLSIVMPPQVSIVRCAMR